jgi:hypothetical protein
MCSFVLICRGLGGLREPHYKSHASLPFSANRIARIMQSSLVATFIDSQSQFSLDAT